MSEPAKRCPDCRWYLYANRMWPHRCGHPKHVGRDTDYLIGEDTAGLAEENRGSILPWKCGKRGRHWEAK